MRRTRSVRRTRCGEAGAADDPVGCNGTYAPTRNAPIVVTVTGWSPTGTPSAYVTSVTSASRRSLLPMARAYAAPPVVPFV